MTLSRRRITPYAAGLLAALALAACSGGGPAPSATPAGPASTAISSPPAPTTSKPTATVDPALARIPTAARVQTEQGAEAFAAFYVEQVNKAWSGPDPKRLEGLSSAECKTCVAFRESAERLMAEGHRHGAKTLTLTHVSAYNFVEKEKLIAVYVTQNAVPVVDQAGRQVDTTKAGTGAFILTMTYDTTWIVERLQTAKS